MQPRKGVMRIDLLTREKAEGMAWLENDCPPRLFFPFSSCHAETWPVATSQIQAQANAGGQIRVTSSGQVRETNGQAPGRKSQRGDRG